MKISEYLLSKGMKPHLKGFDYLIEAIGLCQKDKTYLRALTKRLYPEIAEKYKDSPSNVERSLRHCIEVSKNECCTSEFIALALIELE